MALKRGDVVLVPFPFTDLTSAKVRPAVIVSSDPQRNDLTIAFISSIVPEKLANTDFLLSSDNPSFPSTGLKKDSVFKVNKLLTIADTLILRRLGRVPPTLQNILDNLLKKALNLV